MPGGTFKVLGAFHEENGKRHYKGEEFESEHDLDTMFANKFERTSGKTKRARDRDASLDNSGLVMDKDLVQRPEAIKIAKNTTKTKGVENRGAGIKGKDAVRRSGVDPDEEGGDELDPPETTADDTDGDEPPKIVKKMKDKPVKKKKKKVKKVEKTEDDE